MTSTRPSLWREGFKLFGCHWREWIKWMIGFFALTIASVVVMQHFFFNTADFDTLQQLVQAQKDGRKLTPDEINQGSHISVMMLMVFFPALMILILQSFAYIFFFMKRLPGIGTPEFSMDRFLRYVLKSLQVVFILGLIAAFGAALPCFVGYVYALAGRTGYAVASFAVGAVGYGVLIFLAMRLVFVPILAVCDIDPAFKTSWQLTHKKFWRFLGNGVVFILITGVLWYVAVFIERGIVIAWLTADPSLLPLTADGTAPSVWKQFTMPLMQLSHAAIVRNVEMGFRGLNICVYLGLIRAFYCAALGVLYTEQKQIG